MKVVAMSLPYANEPMPRALAGIAASGCRYVGFGLNHAGHPVPAPNATDREIDELAGLFAEHGLQPYVMFAGANPLAAGGIDEYRRRLEVAKQLGVPLVTGAGTWGYRKFPDVPLMAEELANAHRRYVSAMQTIAPYAEELGVTIAIKPHTGNTATARELTATIAAVGSPAVQPFYDPGNVRFYEGVDPAQDITLITGPIPLLCAKDHRGPRAHPDFPVPGEGEVDFPAIFAYLRRQGFDGAVTVERVDGADRKPIPADELDVRMKRARANLAAMAAEAGFQELE